MIKKLAMLMISGAFLFGCSMESDKEQMMDPQALVDSAVVLIEDEGRSAFSKFTEKEWFHGDQYLFIFNMRGKMLVQPAKPEFVGQNKMDLQDADGRFIIQEFIQLLETSDSGWAEYKWPKPGSDEPVSKRTYIRKATMPNGRKVIVGSGAYN